MSTNRPLNMFISYCHADDDFREEFVRHITPLRSGGYIKYWDDTLITPGVRLEPRILEVLSQADMMIALVSADSIASDFIMEKEIPLASKREDEGNFRLVPIILRPCFWTDVPEFSRNLCLPKDGKPITSWKDRDEVWCQVANGLRKIIDEIRVK